MVEMNIMFLCILFIRLVDGEQLYIIAYYLTLSLLETIWYAQLVLRSLENSCISSTVDCGYVLCAHFELIG